MALVSFNDMMAEAERGQYAVGYFECWNLESLFAVADAAEAMRSPVILGFSGISLPNPERVVKDRLSPYAALGLETCRAISVPACLLFNESAEMDWVLKAIELDFSLVMFTGDDLDYETLVERVRQVVAVAHQAGIAVEGELSSVPGLSGELSNAPTDRNMTGPTQAREFVEQTGVDVLAVNVGQVHLHGREKVHLNMARLDELRRALPVPLVLHASTSVIREDVAEAVKRGIRKINVGSSLKTAYMEETRRACQRVGEHYNPYQVVGSGLAEDILVAGRLGVQRVVEDLMRLFGSAGKAG